MCKSVEKVVTGEVFPLFEESKWFEGCKILKRLSFELRDNHTTEEKRLVYYNYAWVLHEINEFDLAKKYTRMIKNIMEKDEEYMKTNEEKYYKVLNLYDQILKEEDGYDEENMSEEQMKIKEDLYMKSYMISRNKVNYLDQAFMAKADLYFLRKDYHGVADICDLIHSYRFYKRMNGEDISENMLNKLDETQKRLMEKLKKKDEKIFNDLINELYPTIDNLSITNM